MCLTLCPFCPCSLFYTVKYQNDCYARSTFFRLRQMKPHVTCFFLRAVRRPRRERGRTPSLASVAAPHHSDLLLLSAEAPSFTLISHPKSLLRSWLRSLDTSSCRPPPATQYSRLDCFLANLPSPSRVGLRRIRRTESFYGLKYWLYAWAWTCVIICVPGTRWF